MQVVVDGILTHYDMTGEGPVLLLLHGWGDRLETFDSIVLLLRDKYSVVRLDLPGFGSTELPKSVWGLQNYADFVAAFCAKLELKNPKAIVGHSNGGAVAILGVATDILLTDKLVLLAAAGVRDRQSLRKAALKIVAKFGKLATFWLPNQYRHALQKRFYGTIGSDMLVAPHLQQTFKRTVSQDIQQDAAKLAVPTLLIYGDQDRATPVESIGVPLHELIKDSRLHIVHGADHFVHQRMPGEIAKQIAEFVG